jgi:hypothetical protein
MKYFSFTAAVLVLLTISELPVLGEKDDEKLVDHINTLDQRSNCKLAVRKIFEGDTDRGMEATLWECANGVQRIEIVFGLSRKDLIFRYLLVNGSAAKAEVLERKYRSTADGDTDFNRPLAPSSRGVLHFDGVRLVSISSHQTLDLTEKNKNAKSLAFINLANAVRTMLLSANPHPEFESISFLRGIFENG